MWSYYLIEQTRDILDGGTVPFDDYIYMKNINGNFGEIRIEDWLAKPIKLIIHDRKTQAEYRYATAGDLIDAGWAAD